MDHTIVTGWMRYIPVHLYELRMARSLNDAAGKASEQS